MADGTPFVVDLDGLSDLLSDLGTFDERVAERVARLDAEMTRLHGTWTGEAAAAQAAAHARLQRGLADMRQGLAEMQSAGTTAHGNYTAAVQTNRSMFEGLA